MLKLVCKKNVTCDGKEYKNYYLEFNGLKVQVKPTFKNDYKKLNLIEFALSSYDND